MSDNNAITRNRTRSPNYPSIGLPEAIDRLKLIYSKQQRYPATREILARLMGYKSLSGASATVVSALSKYGLLEGYGDTLKVSELGQDLVLHQKGDPEYTAALQSAASMPVFFQELHEQYPNGLPSEHSVRANLIKRGFNPKAIEPAIRAYKDTIAFVEAETGELIKESTSPEPPPSPEGKQLPPPAAVTGTQNVSPPTDPAQRAVVIPLSISEWATLQAPFPLSETAWNQMIAVLTAMKPALVQQDSSPSSESSPSAGPEDSDRADN